MYFRTFIYDKNKWILPVALSVWLLTVFTLHADDKNKQDHTSGLKPPRQGGVYVVAHRGVHNDIPENSLAAYQKAIDLGCDYVEIDLRTTKDGHLVSIHNSTIDRYVKGKTGKVNEMTLAELRALDIGIIHGEEWKGTQIPTFEEILDLCQGKIGIYLDLKEASVKQVTGIIKKHKMQKEIIMYAGMKELMEYQKECPECFPMPDPYLKIQLPVMLKKLKPVVIASNFDRCSEEMIKTCHQAGAIVIADETSPEEWEKWINAGMDGIQTDHPAQLIEYLKERKKSFPE